MCKEIVLSHPAGTEANATRCATPTCPEDCLRIPPCDSTRRLNDAALASYAFVQVYKVSLSVGEQLNKYK